MIIQFRFIISLATSLIHHSENIQGKENFSMTTLCQNTFVKIFSSMLVNQSDHRIAGLWWDQQEVELPFILIHWERALGMLSSLDTNVGAFSQRTLQKSCWR